MKNLFDYATKELSQDAFLRWLFENYDCENQNVRKICTDLLNHFSDIKANPHEITGLKTYAQVRNIDIIVEFYFNSKKHVVLIEDKTFSGLHDKQLERYKEEIKKEKQLIKSAFLHYVFYKTDLEKPNLKDKKICEKYGWKPYFFINEIYEIFKYYNNTGSELLDWYIDHIKNLYDKMNNVSTAPMTEWDNLNFRTFFYKKIIPKFNFSEYADVEYDTWNYQGKYNSLAIIKKYKQKYRLYLEITGRPGKDGDFGVIVRVRKDDKPIDDKDNVRYGLKSVLRENDNFFTLRNHKACIAVANSKIKTKLKYTNPMESIVETLTDVIVAFLGICKNDVLKFERAEYSEPKEYKYMIIKINNTSIEKYKLDHPGSDDAKARYDVTRYCWKIKKPDVSEYPYVLSVTNGIVWAVYKVDMWYEVDERYAFEGKPAPPKIRNNFLNKKIPETYRNKGAANPVRYMKK